MELFQFTQEESHVYAEVYCDKSTPVIDHHAFNSAFEHSEFYQAFLIHEQLAELIGQVNDVLETIEKDGAEPGSVKVKIAEIRDAKVVVKVSDDRMSARAIIDTPWGGKHASVDDVKRVAKMLQIQHFNPKDHILEYAVQNKCDNAEFSEDYPCLDSCL